MIFIQLLKSMSLHAVKQDISLRWNCSKILQQASSQEDIFNKQQIFLTSMR